MNYQCHCKIHKGTDETFPEELYSVYEDCTGKPRRNNLLRTCVNRIAREKYATQKARVRDYNNNKKDSGSEIKTRTWVCRCPNSECRKKHKLRLLWSGRQKNADGSWYEPKKLCSVCSRLAEYFDTEGGNCYA